MSGLVGKRYTRKGKGQVFDAFHFHKYIYSTVLNFYKYIYS